MKLQSLRSSSPRTARCATLFALVGCLSITHAQAGLPSTGGSPSQGDPGLSITPDKLPKYGHELLIGPVQGLTTDWHTAPKRTAIPTGTMARFRVEPHVGTEITEIEWSGAVPSAGFSAFCPIPSGSEHEIVVRVTDNANTTWETTCRLVAVDVATQDIQIVSAAPIVPELAIDLDASQDRFNQQAVDIWFGKESVAQVAEIAPDYYATSVERDVLVDVETLPRGFEPLMEWRVQGGASGLTGDAQRYYDIGLRSFEVGPPSQPLGFELEVYKAHVTSHGGGDVIDTAGPVTFTAATEPAGFEPYLTWMASTKYGSTVPVFGRGSTFTTTYVDTWGLLDDGTPWQWVGVSVDNASFGQDEKGCELGMASIDDPVIVPGPPLPGGAVTFTVTGRCPIGGVLNVLAWCGPRGGDPPAWAPTPGGSLVLAGCPASAVIGPITCQLGPGDLIRVLLRCCCSGGGPTACFEWDGVAFSRVPACP